MILQDLINFVLTFKDISLPIDVGSKNLFNGENDETDDLAENTEVT